MTEGGRGRIAFVKVFNIAIDLVFPDPYKSYDMISR